MPFQQFKLDKSVNQARDIFDKYIYKPDNGDLSADVQVVGYFAESRFASGDNWFGSIIEVDASDAFLIGQITANGSISILFDSSTTAAAGVTTFNGRSGVVSPEETDYQAFYADRSDVEIIVTTPAQLSGVLDSSKVYVLDGVINFTGTGLSIEVPAGGLNIKGHTFDVSKLVCSDAAYTLFTSPGGGSGNLLGTDYAVEVSGAGSQVYDLVSDTGAEAFEFSRVNYNNCSSLGKLDNYRQGFESGTGRFGGSPTLTLVGAWSGGYFIDSSIVRSLDVGMTGGLFEAGAGFTMQSRFRSNMNIDLPASASFFDFSSSNFPNSSTVQITGAIVTRNGVSDATDPNITPNLSNSELASAYTGNFGMQNTFVGGMNTVSAEVATTIVTQSVYEDLNATWAASGLQHYDSPAPGQLRHLGVNPIDFKVTASLTIDGIQNEDITVRVQMWDDSASVFVEVSTQSRQINNLLGARDVAFFTVITNVVLNTNDYVKLQVRNNSSSANVTAELDSYFLIEER